jgi:hypothetical protein
MERAVYRELGQSWDEFCKRPAREVHEYLTIISLITREQNAAHSQPRGGMKGAR